MKPYLYIIATLLLLLPCFENNAQTISGVVNSYYKVTDYVPAYNGIRVQNISGLSPGNRVMIIQMKGATPDETNTSSFGNINAVNDAGKYEFATICGFLNDTVIFEKVLLNTYDYTKKVQLVYVPMYTNVTISATLQAQEWDSTAGTGGIVAIEATGTITLNADVSADSAGFRGGPLYVNTTNRCGPVNNWYYSLAQSSPSNLGGAPKGEGIALPVTGKEYGRGKFINGGGGGNVDETGGGGGSNYGTGGNGGNKSNTTFCNATTSGRGGTALAAYGYSAANNRIFLGGGGGTGEANNIYAAPYPAGTPGGDGGGIVFIRCNTLVGNGYKISANGAQGVNPGLPVKTEAAGDGGGGGGGGGTVLLFVNSYSGNLTVEARGANGSNAGFQNQCPGPGGGGGGGVVWSDAALPVNVTTNISGGASGIIKNAPSHNPPCELQANGATSGSNGIVQTGFQIPEGGIFNCGALLSISSLKEWTGKRITDGVALRWKLEQTQDIEEVWLEKKSVRGPFKTVKIFEHPAEGAYTYTDASNEFPATYRLMLMDKTGKKVYSSQLFFEREKVKRLTVYPNPVVNELRIELPVTTAGRTTISVFDFAGKLVASKEMMFTTNQPFITIPVNHLTPGTYTVRCYWRDELYIAKIVKQ